MTDIMFALTSVGYFSQCQDKNNASMNILHMQLDVPMSRALAAMVMKVLPFQTWSIM